MLTGFCHDTGIGCPPRAVRGDEVPATDAQLVRREVDAERLHELRMRRDHPRLAVGPMPHLGWARWVPYQRSSVMAPSSMTTGRDGVSGP